MGVSFTAVDETRTRTRFDGTLAPLEVELPERYQWLNFCNANARALLRLVGLETEDLYGQHGIAEFRRGIIRARNGLSSRTAACVRETEVRHGPARELEDGTVELRPVRAISFGLDAEGLALRLDILAGFVEAAAAAGATAINFV